MYNNLLMLQKKEKKQWNNNESKTYWNTSFKNHENW